MDRRENKPSAKWPPPCKNKKILSAGKVKNGRCFFVTGGQTNALLQFKGGLIYSSKVYMASAYLLVSTTEFGMR